MAYASKYYDPVKAHEYYMRNRELKGYENRYGGSRGDGTSAASGDKPSDNGTNDNPNKTHNQYVSDNIKSIQKDVRNKNTTLSKEYKRERDAISTDISKLRKSLSNMSKEERKKNKESITKKIESLRKRSAELREKEKKEKAANSKKAKDQVQRLREQTTGGSTSGFNEKGIAAAEYIKKEIDRERKAILKKVNAEVDKHTLGSAKKLAKQISDLRKSGQSINNKEFLSHIKALLGEAAKTKLSYKREYTNAYKQKYKDEIDRLRSDHTMYSYYNDDPYGRYRTSNTNASRNSNSAKTNGSRISISDGRVKRSRKSNSAKTNGSMISISDGRVKRSSKANSAKTNRKIGLNF